MRSSLKSSPFTGRGSEKRRSAVSAFLELPSSLPPFLTRSARATFSSTGGIFLAALALLPPFPAHADTLIDNVQGVTLNAEGRVQRFTGLLISDEGKIVRLLQPGDSDPLAVPRKKKERERAIAARPAYRIDGQGRVMIPGLIDAHGHVMGLGWQALTLDLSDTKSLADAQAKIAGYARDNPSRKWIVGRGWNQETWGLGRFPTAADLDAAVSDRPVWLERVDGHAGWANSAAMTAAGITAKSISPPGGKIELTGGKPSGVFIDAASSLVEKAVPQPLSKDRDVAFVKAQEALLKFGITGIADMGTSIEDWNTFRRAGDTGRLQMRIFSYSAGIDPMLAIAGGEPTPWLYADKLRMAGVKLYADGALGSRGAWLKAPYADKPDMRGLQFLEDSKLRNLMSRAAMDGFQIAIHAIGDAANAQALEAFAEMNETYKGDRRWRIEHAQIVDPNDIPRFAQLGVIASMQPVHQTSDRTMAEARLGQSRLAGAYAWKSFKNAGARLAFGSDTPVESPDPFAGLSAAMTREDANGQPPGGWRPEERVSREEAFAGFTTGGAYASFAENKVGRIAPGLWADFVFLDRDPMAVNPIELRKSQVLETWVGGRKVYSKPK
jgi:predicted amidohydrolase YtcJ